MDDEKFMKIAIEQAKKSLSEGVTKQNPLKNKNKKYKKKKIFLRKQKGIPIGSCLIIDNKIIGKGHNQRVQKKSSILHAEMDCFENAGRLTSKEYEKATLYSTLSL